MNSNIKTRLRKVERRGKKRPNIIVIFPYDGPETAAAKEAEAAGDKNAVVLRVVYEAGESNE
jgi:hypothetical protein